MNSDMKATCKYCGAALPLEHKGPCPKCGKEGKEIIGIVNKTIPLTESLRRFTRTEFFDKNPIFIWLNWAIVIGAPLLGLFLSGIVGAFAGFAFGVLSNSVSPYAARKIIRIEIHT